MKTIYIDSAYRCFTTAADGRKSVETNAFDSLCDNAIETMIFVPAGETYKGAVCTEGFIQCMDSKLYNAYQKQYEAQKAEAEQLKAELADADAALAELGVTIDG